MPVSEFDYEKHIGKLFVFPEGELSKDTLLYAWQWCETENETEEIQLMENGDMVEVGDKNYLINKKQ